MKDSLIAAFLVLSVLLGCETARQKTPEEISKSDLIVTEIESAPVEYKLAYLDNGHLPRGTDVHAARIRYLLLEVSNKTGDTPASIADQTTKVRSVLRESYGRDVTHERFLEEAKEYFAAGGPKLSYKDLSMLLTMGMSK